MAAYRALHSCLTTLAAGLMVWTVASGGALAAAPQGDGLRSAGRSVQPAQRDVHEWLARMQEASRERSYIGTFIVLSSTGALSSSRIWHARDGRRQCERVESLTGAPRSTFRSDDQVVTFLPADRVVRVEKRDSLGTFPDLLQNSGASVPDFYSARLVGEERVAGFDAEVVDVVPKDPWRFGYRVWSEKRTGLVVKLQTRDAQAAVLEQAAFSELVLDAPVRVDRLLRLMTETAGYRVEKADPVKTTPEQEGWAIGAPLVAGFMPMDCYRRPAWTVAGSPPASQVATGAGTLQCVFSDGLASVSVFIEPYDDAQRQAQESSIAMGATQALAQRLDTNWWFTAVGEVPAQTLRMFSKRFVRAAPR